METFTSTFSSIDNESTSTEFFECYDDGNIHFENGSAPNMTLHAFPNELWYKKDGWNIAVKTIAFLPIVMGGLIGNSHVIYAIKSNKLSSTNLFIGNMALCDFCALLMGPWMLIVVSSFQNYILGPFFCKFEGFIQSTLLLGGVLSLTAVSCDRLVVIVFPQHKGRMGLPVTFIVIAITWVIGIGMSVPLITHRHYKERQWCDFLECYCTEDFDKLESYWKLLLLVLVWFPLVVMILCYSAIFIKLKRYERAVKKNPLSHPIRKDFRSRVTRMVLLLLLVFIICRGPFTALIYFRASKDESSEVSEAFRILWFVAHYLIYANAAINPLIYGMTNEALRPRMKCGSNKTNKIKVLGAYPTKKISVLEPREPYHIEPNWRPINKPNAVDITVKINYNNKMK